MPLGDLCTPKQWLALSRSEMVGDGYPVYGANGVIGYASRYTHLEPTVLIGCRGTIGAIHVSTPRSFVTSNAMALDALDSQRVHQGYLARFLAWRGFVDVTSGSSQPQLTRQNLVRVAVPLPSLDEQRQIAAILDRASLLLLRRRSELAAIDEARVSAFYAHFADGDGRLSLTGAGVLDDWVDSARPVTYGILMPGPNVEQGVPYIRVADMKDRRINLDTVRSTANEIDSAYARSRLRSGDLVMSIRGHVGRFASVPSQLDGANITQDSARISIADRSRSAYVRAVMESVELQEWMRRHSKGAAVRGINLADLRNAPIPEADRDTIRRFADLVAAIDAQRARVQRAIDLHDELFAALQSCAFKGEL